jgi:mycothiol synthase
VSVGAAPSNLVGGAGLAAYARAVRSDAMPPDLVWRSLTPDDLTEVAALAERCRASDGGLPAAARPSFLRSRYAAEGGAARGATDAAGTLVAAVAVRPQGTATTRRAVVTGLVDPARRGRGIGGELLDWGLSTAASTADRVTVETEALTDDARRLFAARGLRQVFAEDVMRADVGAGGLPAIVPPDGVALAPWSPELAPRFFAAYEAAFRQRPGFPGWSAQQWIAWTMDDDFRPQWSLLATDRSAGDVGFITCAEGWIVQVGVRPEHRGRRLGTALVVEALRRMGTDGATEAYLDVNVDNSAGVLYRRLGFALIARRARFEPPAGDREDQAGTSTKCSTIGGPAK